MIDYIAGIAGGFVVVLVGHPFDTIKTRLQTAPSNFYASTMDCVAMTFKQEGLKGFYAGMYSPLIGQMIFRSVSFATYHNCTQYLSKYDKSHHKSEISASNLILAGSITGFVISFIETPIDLIKTKLQIQIFNLKLNPSFKPEFVTTKQCIIYTIMKYKLPSLWQGLQGTLIRNIPANALFFPVNELSKRTFSRLLNKDVSELPMIYRLTSGALAGLCYWGLTYPLDVIKGKLMSLPYEERQSWIKVARQLWIDGGNSPRYYMRGFIPCVTRSIPACGAMFTTVDLVRENLKDFI